MTEATYVMPAERNSKGNTGDLHKSRKYDLLGVSLIAWDTERIEPIPKNISYPPLKNPHNENRHWHGIPHRNICAHTLRILPSIEIYLVFL
jgi:hypothetical protein